MYNIKQSWLDRITGQYFNVGEVINGTYDGEVGIITFQFKTGEIETAEFSYEGLDISHFMRALSDAVAGLIIAYNTLHIDRTPFINSVSTNGQVNQSIIDYVVGLFNKTFTATYDGNQGTIYMSLTDVNYEINYSYSGDAFASFRETLLQAIGYAIQYDNATPWPIAIVDLATDKTGQGPITIVLTAPPATLDNIFDNVDATGFPIDGEIGY